MEEKLGEAINKKSDIEQMHIKIVGCVPNMERENSLAGLNYD